MADMERRLRMEQKLVQRCSRSRVYLLHVKFLRTISRNPVGLLKNRMNGGIGYWGDCRRSISIIKLTIYSGRGLKSDRRKLKASVGERSTGGRVSVYDFIVSDSF
ncbi:hypothetical protein Droror1_Dr00011590 [Drosera rotundifolia]